MKRILPLLLALSICIVSLSGCKKADDGTSSSSTASSSSSISSEMPSSNETSSQTSSITSSETTPTANTPIVIDGIDFSDVEKLDNKRHGWGQGNAVDKTTNRPVSCDQYQAKYGKDGGLFILPKTEKSIALTFDEGYENGYTSKILDVLKEKNVKATFFVTYDYVKTQPALVKRMIAEGHTVGNHSMKHKSMPSLTTQEDVKEIVDLHNYVLKNFNYTMSVFRPPMGEWSEKTLSVAKKLGYQTAFWSFAYKDYDTKSQPNPTDAYNKITKAAHPGGLFLLHAVSKTNTEILGKVIDNFKSQGYELINFNA